MSPISYLNNHEHLALGICRHGLFAHYDLHCHCKEMASIKCQTVSDDVQRGMMNYKSM